ncbi:MAG TPA: zf-HC2 domain-containing protein [Kofleriaceae bacterium]|nr:zf-HC2 domain-containing protein [Kofleriaceae bacterium]
MSHPSSLDLDALAAGKLPSAEATAVRAHVAECARCRADLAAAESACAHFTRDVLPRTLPALRARAPKRTRWWAIAPAILVPAFAVLALVWWTGRQPAGPPDEPDLLIKGGMSFQVFANRGGEVIPVRDGTRLAAGDSIRFVVGTGGPRYVIVASIDGAGNTTIYYPYDGERSGDATKSPTELPGSIVLDTSPGPERVFALASAEPLEGGAVKRALAELGARGGDAIRTTRTLPVQAAAQASIVFEKVAP